MARAPGPRPIGAHMGHSKSVRSPGIARLDLSAAYWSHEFSGVTPVMAGLVPATHAGGRPTRRRRNAPGPRSSQNRQSQGVMMETCAAHRFRCSRGVDGPDKRGHDALLFFGMFACAKALRNRAESSVPLLRFSRQPCGLSTQTAFCLFARNCICFLGKRGKPRPPPGSTTTICGRRARATTKGWNHELA